MALERFVTAQESVYQQALSEIKNGKKRSHWMWFIFPQLKGLGFSKTAVYYGIDGINEAASYLRHPVLGSRIIEISIALLQLKGQSAAAIFGYPDDLKLHSSMTLFSQFENADPVFREIIVKYFNGKPDIKTIELL